MSAVWCAVAPACHLTAKGPCYRAPIPHRQGEAPVAELGQEAEAVVQGGDGLLEVRVGGSGVVGSGGVGDLQHMGWAKHVGNGLLEVHASSSGALRSGATGDLQNVGTAREIIQWDGGLPTQWAFRRY